MPDGLPGTEWNLLGWGLFIPFIVWLVHHGTWRRLSDPGALNVWLGSIVLLSVLSTLKAGIYPGLPLQLSGGMLLTLLCGPRLAVLALALVQVVSGLNAGEAWSGLGWAMLLRAGFAVGVALLLARFVERIRPPLLFVYLFGNGFFGAGLVAFAVNLAHSLLLAALGAYSAEFLLSDHLPYAMLLAFAEAWLSGMLLTLFVIYRPEWLCSFDDSRYLRVNIKK